MLKMKVTAIAAVMVALMAGCGTGGGGHPQVTQAGTSTAAVPSASPVPAGVTVAAACARFRGATIVMSESGPTDPAALRRFGRAMRHLSGELASQQSGSGRALGTALAVVSARALAIAAGHTPKGLIAAYNVVKQDAAKVDAACPSAAQ
jgi:hypothetical protein